VHIIKLPNPISKMAILKIIIITDSETNSRSEPLMVLFYGNLLNSAHGYIQMVVTIDVVTENVCMCMCWRAEQEAS
jgi:hypothetical protein